MSYSMNNHFETLILGGGCIGSSILFALNRLGIKNTALVDSGLKTTSATSQSAGMLRSFHENPVHTELAIRSRQLLDTYRREESLHIKLVCSGSLYFFHKDRLEGFEKSLKIMQDNGCAYEIITPSLGQKEFSEFHWGDDDLAIYESNGTYLNPLMLVGELQSYSEAQGASIFSDTKIHHIELTDGRYHLVADGRTFSAKQLILAGGAAMLPLLRDIDIDLPLEDSQLSLFTSPSVSTKMSLPNYFDRETLEHGRLTPGCLPLISTQAPERLKCLGTDPNSIEIRASDSYAPGRLGLIVNPPGHPHMTVATGWGGTALKFSLEIGHRCAERLTSKSKKHQGNSYDAYI